MDFYEHSGAADDSPEALASEQSRVYLIAGHPYVLDLANPKNSGYRDPKGYPELYGEAFIAEY